MSTLTDSELKEIIVTQNSRIRDLMLGSGSIGLLRLVIDNETMTTRKLFEIQKTSIENCSVKLQKLYRRGYLQRKEIEQPSGGIEYQYFSAINIPPLTHSQILNPHPIRGEENEPVEVREPMK